MIETKIIVKQKGAAKGTGVAVSSASTGGTSQGSIEHALSADKAKKAETADTANYANTAGYAARAGFASKAGELSEDADVLQRYLRKDVDDTAKGVITFEQVQKALKGFLIGQGYQFDENGNIVAHTVKSDTVDAGSVTANTVTANDVTSKHDTTDELVAQVIATIAQLKVQGDSIFSGSLSSPEFISGFLAGKGWRIKNVPTLNAAGVLENKYTEEIDNLIVRGSMRVYEMIISQLLGENDNRIFTAMLEVDHYDPETGKVYLDTKEGRYFNPFRKDDCIMVQQYNGMPSAENNYYVTKNYELIVTEVGSEGSGEDMLAWVKFRNFTCSMEGATPEQMITKKDTFVRVDNLTDPDRKGIIQMMTVGSDTPYMDVIHGLKTDPQNALKGRLGNLQGIVHPIFGALKGFGEYLNNLYATGDLILRRTGESIDTKFQMLENMFSTRFAQTSYDLSNEDNYLENGQFLQKVDATESETLIDSWDIESQDDTQFWVDANGLPMMVNGMATVSGNHRVSIEGNEGRNMLRIQNCGISQKNAIIRKPGTHKEYSNPSTDKNEEGFASTGDSYVEVQDKLYVSLKIYAKAAGTLTLGFEGCSTVQGKSNDLAAKTYDVPYDGEWKVVKMEGKWNGTGNFVVRFTGDAYISLASITDEPLSEFSKTVSTQIQQTATNIKLLGENIDKVNGTATQLGIDLDTEKKQIRQYVTEVDNANRTDTSSQITQTANSITSTVNKSIKDQYDTITKEYGSAITQNEREIHTWVEEKSYSTTGELSAAKTEIKQTTDAISLSASKAQNTANGAVKSISELSVTVDGIKTTVSGKVDSDTYNKAKEVLDKAVKTAQGTADDAATAASNAQTAASNAQTAADNAKSYAETQINQTNDAIDAFTAKVAFDGDGNITNISKSGLLVTSDKTELTSSISDVEGKIQSEATIKTWINNGISNATIEANKINLSGHTMAFGASNITIDTTNFKLDSSGNVTMKGAVTATSGKIGLLDISSNGELSQHGMKITSSGMEFRNTVIETDWYTSTYYFKVNTRDTSKPIAEIHGVDCYNGALKVNASSSSSSNRDSVPLVVEAAGGLYDAIKCKSGMFSGFRPRFRSGVKSSTELDDYDCVVHCENTSQIIIWLPKNPYPGQMILIIQHGTGKITISGNGSKIYAWGHDGDATFESGTRYQFTWCFYDGSYWDLGWHNH